MVLAYPRIFKGSGNLQAMTRTVTVVNEFGELETHEIFNKNDLTHLALFPFTQEGQDSSLNWLQYGIYEAVGEDLTQFTYMSIHWNEDQFQLHEQIKAAQTQGLPFFLTGTYRQDGDLYEIKSKLYHTGNGGLLKERVFTGRDLFGLVDSISLQTRVDLGIPGILLNSSVDLPFRVYYTDMLEAYEYCIKGYYIDSFSYYLNKAVELDSTFAMALYYRAEMNYNFQINEQAARNDICQAMRHRERMTDFREISTRIRYYAILGEKDKAMMHLGEMLLHKGDMEATEKLYHRAILLDPEEEKYWSRLLDHRSFTRFLIPFMFPLQDFFMRPS